MVAARGSQPASEVGNPGASNCALSLQARVDEAPAGSVVTVPACIYRETLSLTKAVTVVGQPGAEIRGADVWRAWDGRVSQRTVPYLKSAGACLGSAPRCSAGEQVVLDGNLLTQVRDHPGAGEFALDADRRVLLGQDPAGHAIEVTTRERWMEIAASDVTVAGFTMRYAANAAQTGALAVANGASNVMIRDVDLGDASGAAISFGGADRSTLLRAVVHDNGQLGVHLGGDPYHGRGNSVLDSRIFANNTHRYDPEWESGGLKATRQERLLIAGNEIYANRGPGVWCDIYCADTTIRDNRVHDNTHAGIMFEVSAAARIYGNVVYRNGAGKARWGWGAGILISSSGGADIHDNLLAWNGSSGVSVISQRRSDWPAVSPVDNVVHGNTMLGLPNTWLMLWGTDWSDSPLFDDSSHNRGYGNRYWISSTSDSDCFAWRQSTRSLDAFNATPGEEQGTYLSVQEVDELLRDATISTTQ